mmetsp:Transcript_18799/g.59435  ORF Transcript_18799/g.59435 Transcript_18799/m.59435 type:complete len:101 (+) Transcript_18799:44-346(+)
MTPPCPLPAPGRKQSACGCAGVFNAHAAIELYAEAFEEAGALQHLEAFCSLNGPRFYGVEPNAEFITLRREPWTVSKTMPFGAEVVVPFRAGETVHWRIV